MFVKSRTSLFKKFLKEEQPEKQLMLLAFALISSLKKKDFNRKRCVFIFETDQDIADFVTKQLGVEVNKVSMRKNRVKLDDTQIFTAKTLRPTSRFHLKTGIKLIKHHVIWLHLNEIKNIKLLPINKHQRDKIFTELNIDDLKDVICSVSKTPFGHYEK